MVKVIVGIEPNTYTFHAHEGILSKSSFFERALNGGFKESITREVKLPEDDPDIFSSVLEYLYCQEYSPRITIVKADHWAGPTFLKAGARTIPGYAAAPEQPELQGAAAMRHAKIYCLAEKFGMTDLQELVLEKLRLCGPVRDIQFIKLGAYLLENASDSRGSVSAFLKPYVVGIPRS